MPPAGLGQRRIIWASRTLIMLPALYYYFAEEAEAKFATEWV
jgi:hypothetical protein